jgi:hypothetical protein
MILRLKGFKLMIFFYNPFEHIWIKSTFDPKIMDFENAPLTKLVHIYVIEGMNALFIYEGRLFVCFVLYR